MEKNENMLRSCLCKETDKRLIILFTQIVFSFIVLGFSCIQLVKTHELCNDGADVYIGLISSIVSYWIGKQHNNN